MTCSSSFFHRKKAVAEGVPPLLMVTTQQAQSIIGQRAEQILRCSERTDSDLAVEEDGDNEISCTPAFPESELGRRVGGCREAASSRHEMTGNRQEKSDEKHLQINNEMEMAVEDGAYLCVASSDSSSDKVSNKGEEPEFMCVDAVAEPERKGSDLSPGEELEQSDSENSCPVAKTGTTKHNVSLHEDFQDVDYPTLWQLTSQETENLEHFYVPALVSVVSPVKVQYTLYDLCWYIYVPSFNPG